MANVPQSSAPPVSVPTILVVENEVLVRMPLAEYLRDCGYRAVEAVNAAQDYIVGRKLIAARAVIAPGRLADLSVPVKSLA